MKPPKVVLRILATIVIGLLYSIPGSAQSNNLITPVVTVYPYTFPINQRSTVFLSFSNGNPNSKVMIQEGDKFKITFESASQTALMLEGPMLVNSSSLMPGDFDAAFKTEDSILITYLSPTTTFPPGDSFGIKVSFLATSQVKAARIICEVVPRETGVYNDMVPAFVNISLVDFPAGPKGLNWKKAWNPATNYLTDDAVSYNGSSWIARRDHANVTPVEGDDWTIVAQKGEPGAPGTAGSVFHDMTLTGDGSVTVPLGVKMPLNMSGPVFPSSGAMINATNSFTGGEAINATSTNGVAVRGRDTGTGTGLLGSSSGTGVRGQSSGSSGIGIHGVGNTGVLGESTQGAGYGVKGTNITGIGVLGMSTSNAGVHGESGTGSGVHGKSTGGFGVFGESQSGNGVLGTSITGNAVGALSDSGDAVVGVSASGRGVVGSGPTGVDGSSTSGIGVVGRSDSGRGVYGLRGTGSASSSTFDAGVVGDSDTRPGVIGSSQSNSGVYGEGSAATTAGVYGFNANGHGVIGDSPNGVGVRASGNVGVKASGTTALEIVNGAIKVTGAGVGTNTAAFIHEVTDENRVDDDFTILNHPLINDDPNVILFVTYRHAIGHTPVPPSPMGVKFNGSRWIIQMEDGDMHVGMRFNVLIIKQ